MIELYTTERDGSETLAVRDTPNEIIRFYGLGPHSSKALRDMKPGDERLVSWHSTYTYIVRAI